MKCEESQEGEMSQVGGEQGWAIALFGKERIALFLLKRAKKARKSNSLFGALFKRAKERFALWRSF